MEPNINCPLLRLPGLPAMKAPRRPAKFRTIPARKFTTTPRIINTTIEKIVFILSPPQLKTTSRFGNFCLNIM